MPPATAGISAAIADAVKALPDVPRELVLRLASDQALAVCDPVIRMSPLLTDADLLELLSGRSIRHVVTGVKLDDGDQGEAEHPVLRVHPLTGRTSLYLTSPARCAAITGLSEQETAETVALLLEHSTRPDNLYRHAWSAGDVVMWDNGCVLHRADHEGVVGDRVMHRGMSLGYALAGRHAG